MWIFVKNIWSIEYILEYICLLSVPFKLRIVDYMIFEIYSGKKKQHSSVRSERHCLHEAPLPICPCKNLTGEVNAGFCKKFCIYFTNGVQEVHKPAQRRQRALQSTSWALPPLEWCPQNPRSPPGLRLASSGIFPILPTPTPSYRRQFFLKSSSLHTLSWSCFSYWQLFPCSSLRLAAPTGTTSSALRFCPPRCADFHSANKVI